MNNVQNYFDSRSASYGKPIRKEHVRGNSLSLVSQIRTTGSLLTHMYAHSSIQHNQACSIIEKPHIV